MRSTTIDKDWFLGKISENNKYLRGLARHLDIDASSASRMFDGKRKMKMEEANAIARFLNVSVQEVLAHIGVSIDVEKEPTNILLASHVSETGELSVMKEPRPLPPQVVERVSQAIRSKNVRVLAAQIRAAKGALRIWDDAVLIFHHTDIVDPAAIGSLSVVRVREGGLFLCHLERARKTGEATLRLPEGGLRDVVLVTATPVIAVIP